MNISSLMLQHSLNGVCDTEHEDTSLTSQQCRWRNFDATFP